MNFKKKSIIKSIDILENNPIPAYNGNYKSFYYITGIYRVMKNFTKFNDSVYAICKFFHIANW